MRPADTCLGIWSTVRGREDVARAERLQQHAPVEQRVEVVGVRVAEVDGRPRRGRARSRIGVRRRSISANASSQDDLLESVTRVADERRAEPVGVLVQLLQRGALGADEAVAEDVLRVAADRRSPGRPSSVSSSPQVASQSGQVRKAVRVAVIWSPLVAEATVPQPSITAGVGLGVRTRAKGRRWRTRPRSCSPRRRSRLTG